ncbi:nucleotidyl transferase AbiEii/AbiGii toxin family protein [Patescibacteria group bacterium]|nr:nucleotidyl transferase AbiEii/AbiGii toxin family protein [Patescibacteria group bacterium]MCG2694710.1 nucleotidyl transferase AbiEii/AbiGii toxin family protein [Candidatus Parcubacteria bacterium]
MRVDKNRHKKIMLNILADISKNSAVSPFVGFKGGTACYFLYGLDRFSVDLDFDLLDMEKIEEVKEEIKNILVKYGTLKEDSEKTTFKIVYNSESSALKIDLSTRDDINRFNSYEVKDIVSSVPLKILSKEDIFAHKLVAVTDRYNNKTRKDRVIANRDIYDIYFFFTHNFGFNEKIIELRTGKTVVDYLNYLIDFIKNNVDNKNILDGLGSLADEEKRVWIKENLKKEILILLEIEKKSRINL